MTSLRRTLDVIASRKVDTVPFHPIIMQFAANYAGLDYRDFCLVPERKVQAMIKCANDFDLDWVTVLSDPYVEAEAFGLPVEYPKNSLPYNSAHLIADTTDIDRLTNIG